jgi:glycosyltransferase involved in cell wall biosynthesis
LKELEGKNVRIVRTGSAGPGRFLKNKETVSLPPEWARKLLSRLSDTFFIPDNKRGWRHRALVKALELHQETPFDLIFATAPPFTSFLIGKKLKDRINRPLVLDYRDPWVDNPFKFFPTPLHKWANAALERSALRASSHVVTTNRRVKELLISRYRFLTYHDIDIISQGFDPEDYDGISPAPRPAPPRGPGKFRIAYAGIFWEDRVPDYFLRAVVDLLKERPSLRNEIELVFIGTFREENKKLVARLGLSEIVTVLGYLSHRECIAQLLAADLLWLVVGDDLGSPGKTYEYVGAGKPILACAPVGFIRNTVLEAGGMAVGPKDSEGIKRALLEFYTRFTEKRLEGPRQAVVDKYNRVALTGQMVKLFESLFEP